MGWGGVGGGFTLTTETHQGRNNGRADEMIYLTSRKICGTLAHKPNLLIYPIKRYKRDDNKWTCKILLVKIIYCPSLFSGQSILKVPKFCFCGVNPSYHGFSELWWLHACPECIPLPFDQPPQEVHNLYAYVHNNNFKKKQKKWSDGQQISSIWTCW